MLINILKSKKKIKHTRSVVFYRHNYYHFYYLAIALRKRGWDAISVNLEDTNGQNANYYHGEDLNLFDEDGEKIHKNIKKFFKKAVNQYRLVHFSGDGYLCFYPEYWNLDNPPDITVWRKYGNKIAYTVSGCNSGITPDSLMKWSRLDMGREVCTKCVWQNNLDVCSNAKSIVWGRKVKKYSDVIFSETLPSLDFMHSQEAVIREPLTMCLDSNIWSPDLTIPEAFRLDKKPGEILIYHSMGNFKLRNKSGANIKGTPVIFSAIERLKQNGYPVRLIFFSDMKNINVRFMQSQADIVVDQLNMGRYGANARESMMLGKPVICYLNKHEIDQKDQLESLKECPLISATEENIYDILKWLIDNPLLCRKISAASREYALKWHDADRCAERYEKLYDKLIIENAHEKTMPI